LSLSHKLKLFIDYPLGDNKKLELNLPLDNFEVFDAIPETLSDDTYYVPLSTNFPVIDALTKKAALQYSVTPNHPMKGVRVLENLASLFSSHTLDFVFIVPMSVAAGFPKQKILTSKGAVPQSMPLVRQWVVGLPLGIDTSYDRKRKRSEG
jgi:hypothetical protein